MNSDEDVGKGLWGSSAEEIVQGGDVEVLDHLRKVILGEGTRAEGIFRLAPNVSPITCADRATMIA